MLSFTLIAFCTTTFAQDTSNLEVFSENGETFTLIVNGKKVNSAPEANVKASGLTGDFLGLTIQFSDPNKPEIRQNLMITPGMEQRAIIKLAKKGYVLRPFGEPVAIGSGSTAVAAIPSSPTPAPVAERTSETIKEQTVQQPTVQTTIVTTSTTTTTDNEQVKMDIGAGDMKMGIDVKITDGGFGSSTTVHSTETTTITTAVSEPQAKSAPTEQYVEPAVASESLTKEVPVCSPMAGGDFADAKKTIASQSFEDSKITTANQVLKSSCMSTDQIKDVMSLFSFEESKISFAKAAYHRCPDNQNFWKLNDAFTFESSIDDLNDYIEKQ